MSFPPNRNDEEIDGDDEEGESICVCVFVCLLVCARACVYVFIRSFSLSLAVCPGRS